MITAVHTLACLLLGVSLDGMDTCDVTIGPDPDDARAWRAIVKRDDDASAQPYEGRGANPEAALQDLLVVLRDATRTRTLVEAR